MPGNKRFAIAAFLVLAASAKGADSVEDPYLWLEDIHGAKPLAWVAEQNDRTKNVLKADPRYQPTNDAILKVLDATDRIPMGGIDKNFVFNFWQDAANPKGVWRRTTLADYATKDPHWETLIDVDKLAAGERENWIWKGAGCTNSLKRCLVYLSRDGGDAHVVREFDMATKTFLKDGFQLVHAKSGADWLDDDTVLFGTDFGPGSMTASGYPRIVKIWHRGEPVDSAKVLYEGKPEDIAVQTAVMSGPHGTYGLVVRGFTFYDSDYFHIRKDGTLAKLPLPSFANLQGMTGDRLIFTLRKDWAVDGATYTKGSLLSVRNQDARRS